MNLNFYYLLINKYIFFIFLLNFTTNFILINSKILNLRKEFKDKCNIMDYFSKFKNIEIKNNHNFYKNLTFEKRRLKSWYKRRSKKNLDLNNPKTFNEKIQWLKLYDSIPMKTLLSDKYLVKDYIKKKIGDKYVIPILKVWDSEKQINFDSLPKKFVIKANHGSGMNIIIHDKNKSNLKKIKQTAKKWLKINYAFKNGFELHYLNIKPKIFAEAYFDNKNGDLYDYKLYCFDGRVESIAFLSGKKKFRRIAFYDPQWNRLNYTDTYPAFENEIPKPKNLKTMIEISSKLSKGFAFVRVDLYVLNNGDIKFGEMTFTPNSGLLIFSPQEQDRIFGDMIKLPIND